MVVLEALSAGVDVQGMREEPQVLWMKVEPFLAADGEKAGQLWPLTRQQGLSMGDRASLSLGPRWPGRPKHWLTGGASSWIPSGGRRSWRPSMPHPSCIHDWRGCRGSPAWWNGA
jgi:hypothetical protein